MVILVFIGIAILNWALINTFYVTGFGLFTAERTEISAKRAGRLKNINYRLNMKVKKGEKLAELDPSTAISGKGLSRGSVGSSGRFITYDEEVLKRKKINILSIIWSLVKEKKRLAGLVTRHVVPRAKLLATEFEIKKYRYQLSLLEIKLKSTIAQSFGDSGESELLSPVDGVVLEIYKVQGEVVQLGETVMVIGNPKKMYIDAYFDESDMINIQVGEYAKIVFTTGERANGIVRKIHPVTALLPPEYRKQFGAQGRYIHLEILINEQEKYSDVLSSKTKVTLKKNLLARLLRRFGLDDVF